MLIMADSPWATPRRCTKMPRLWETRAPAWASAGASREEFQVQTRGGSFNKRAICVRCRCGPQPDHCEIGHFLEAPQCLRNLDQTSGPIFLPTSRLLPEPRPTECADPPERRQLISRKKVAARGEPDDSPMSGSVSSLLRRALRQTRPSHAPLPIRRLPPTDGLVPQPISRVRCIHIRQRSAYPLGATIVPCPHRRETRNQPARIASECATGSRCPTSSR